MSIVKECWRSKVIGCMSFQITQKLKKLKGMVKTAFQEPIQVKFKRFEEDFLSVQNQLHQNPNDQHLASAEYILVAQYRSAKRDYGEFLKQKAKLSWLKYSDENTLVFHQSIKQRAIHNKINMLCINDAILTAPLQIQDAFYSFYSNLL